MLTQNQDIVISKISGASVEPRLTITSANVQLSVTAGGRSLANPVVEPVGSAAANTLLSYVDQSTGQLTTAGEAWAAALPIAIDGASGTIGNYFS